ncbi:hypothetical protein HIM_11573 [Hirsutella minnesotensis 3608]|uniref:Uncharacterized protein n=1 Tax=Hirsutella minnesotensis 3608 TaxID=1043627 RepID=A0A0F7ZIY1_9HYPO|nr:hypothetical protein HIM_11573 [Hirsutella minnesotensis 3608]
MQPIVSFTGPVIGSGRDLLRGNSAPALDDPQLTCCGFVQLSTFICPGMPGKTPFKGFHPFQVFVIFPIHANPWLSLCRKMTERRDSQFQPNSLFTCTGKIVGLLDHRIMTHAPGFEQDYVLIIVPDTWTFLDRVISNQASATQVMPTTPKPSMRNPSDYGEALARFTSTKKRTTILGRVSPTPPASTSVNPVTVTSKRSLLDPGQTPTKRPRLSPASSTIMGACDSCGSPKSNASFVLSQEDPEESETDAEPIRHPDASASDSIKALTSDSSRPRRTRHRPKKFQ